MTALSQSLDDSPARWTPQRTQDRFRDRDQDHLQGWYSESQRLALEELVSRGLDGFAVFLRRERIPNFLSEEEARRLARGAAAAPRWPSVHGEDPGSDPDRDPEPDCSSVTYFPEVSDVEPPLLEVGWPAFTAGSYRGVTRAVAHFQPSYGDCIYSCKEAARRMIRSAKEVIAIVTDSLTDLDIFRDLQEACTHRNVPVYILLDQTSVSAFLKMCHDIGTRLEDLLQMRVRSLGGTTYYLRSGASISGKIHERFMLIDGNRVATGSYRFNWTDGRLNSSNLVELSGQITEKFDEEFRILYAQSLPFSTQVPSTRAHAGDAHERLLLLKHPNATSSPRCARDGPAHMPLLTSTPGRKPRAPAPGCQPPCDLPIGEAAFDSSMLGDEWAEEKQQQQHAEDRPEIQSDPPTAPTPSASSEVATQACCATADCGSQTEPKGLGHPEQHSSNNGVAPSSSTTTPTTTTTTAASQPTTSPARDPSGSAAASNADASLRDCFTKLSRERQRHYSSIRSRLESMVNVLSQRRELADVTNIANTAAARPRVQQECGKEQSAALLPGEHGSIGTWPRARCLH